MRDEMLLSCDGDEASSSLRVAVAVRGVVDLLERSTLKGIEPAGFNGTANAIGDGNVVMYNVRWP